jgi:type I restriction enzyme, R subunit
MVEDEVFYTSLKQKVEDLLGRFKERQIDIYELMDKLFSAREEILSKVEGKTNSGLKPEEELYFNKLIEVFEGQQEIEELKNIAIEVHRFIEDRVVHIIDWTAKTDFKCNLKADSKIILLKKKISISDASMLWLFYSTCRGPV